MDDERNKAIPSTGKPYARDPVPESPDDLPWAEIIPEPGSGPKASGGLQVPVFRRVMDARGLNRTSGAAARPLASTESVAADSLPPFHVIFLGAAIVILLAMSVAIQIDF